MVRYNIIGTGFLDLAQGGMAFKMENPHYRFFEVTIGRSVEFEVPATDRNRKMLGFGDDPSFYGEMLRRRKDCQLVYDGGAVMGTIAVTAFTGSGFRCIFYIGDAEWVRMLQEKKLSTFPDIWPKGLVWSPTTPIHDANDDTIYTMGECLLRYDNGASGLSPSEWMPMPAINVVKYITDLCASVGIRTDIAVSDQHWLIMSSLIGGGMDEVIFSQQTTTQAAVTQSQGYFSTINFDIEWATARVFGMYIGGGKTMVQGFQVENDVKVKFDNVPAGTYLIRHDLRLGSCECLGGTGEEDTITGMTFDMKKGERFFFAASDGQLIDYDFIIVGGGYFGWKDNLSPVSVQATVSADGDMAIGDTWYLRNNHPDMTFFEFLKSLALATGYEITIDPTEGIIMSEGGYGFGNYVPIDAVTSVVEVSRRVDAWGSDSVAAQISFDSEDYVTQPIVSRYTIDSDQVEAVAEHVCKFSEGGVSPNGILVQDVDATATPPKLAAKRPTIALSTPDSIYLQRVPTPTPVGYDDIAANSTCVVLKTLASEAAFFALKPSTIFLWQGMAYLWTDAQWSDDVLTLTLQKVSQRPATTNQ